MREVVAALENLEEAVHLAARERGHVQRDEDELLAEPVHARVHVRDLAHHVQLAQRLLGVLPRVRELGAALGR